MLAVRKVTIIGVASGQGARDRGCEDGPDALMASGPVQCLVDHFAAPTPFEILRPHSTASLFNVLPSIIEINQRLAHVVERRLLSKYFPVVIGGDHSCAVGTWSGVRAATRSQGSLGLLWVDAHMDSHVPQTSPSGALHGMPLACLLGYGDAGLTRLTGPEPTLNPAHVCLVGIRSFETGEAELLQRLGVRVFFMEEIARRGFAAVWREALAYVMRGTAAYGITIDMDAIDPSDAPGVGTPARGGIAGDDVVNALASLQCDSRLSALEVTEYNPHHDQNQMTLTLLQRMLCAVGARKEQIESNDTARRAILRT